MNIAAIGKTVVIVDTSGDCPALITKVITKEMANLVMFCDETTTFPRYVKIHIDRPSALQAHLKDGQVHAYWPAKV